MQIKVFALLQALVRKYLNGVHQLNVDCIEYKEMLDEPKLHRLLELTVHSIPKAGRARFLYDLLFKGKHQLMKRDYERNRNTPNTYALFSDSTDGWKRNIIRVAHKLSTNTEGEETERKLYAELN